MLDQTTRAWHPPAKPRVGVDTLEEYQEQPPGSRPDTPDEDADDEAISERSTTPQTLAELIQAYMADESGDEISEFASGYGGPCFLELQHFMSAAKDVKSRMEAFHEQTVKCALRSAAQQTKTDRQVARNPDDPSENGGPRINPFDKIVVNKSVRPTVQVLTQMKGSKTYEPLSVRVTRVESPVVSLPKTKSIGRAGPSLLSRNVAIGKYHPYSQEDEAAEDIDKKYNEVQERYNISSNFYPQRACAELVSMYRQFSRTLLREMEVADVVRYYLSTDEECARICKEVDCEQFYEMLSTEKTSKCSTCELSYMDDKRTERLHKDYAKRNISAEVYIRAGLLAHAFREICTISLWHLVSIQCELSPLERASESHEHDEGERICLACGLHNCSIHGTFDDSGAVHSHGPGHAISVNDREEAMNKRWCFATYVKPISPDKHICGVWCTPGSTELISLDSFKGADDQGHTSGYLHEAMNKSTPYIDDREPCSDDCFWIKTNRTDNMPDLSQEEEEVFLANLRQCMTNARGACMMKDMLPNIRCSFLFALMVHRIRQVPHKVDDNQTSRKKSKVKTKSRVDLSGDQPNVRADFFPCDHEGPCNASSSGAHSACDCANAKIPCEVSCNCSESCERRFKGCTCTMGPGKTCRDSRCACWNSGRECDPFLCKGCGVETVLHQLYKYDAKMRLKRCRNNRIQLGLPARTIKAPSEVQGFGLFAGQDLNEDDFIHEYKGEIVSREEADRRGAMYSLSGQEYLFVLNTRQEVDANNYGNKSRFMNNSSKDENINVRGEIKLCNGNYRIGLFAKRDIKKGEELLYNYEYPEAITKHFWERGEKNSKSITMGSHEPAVTEARRNLQLKQKGKKAARENPRSRRDIDDSSSQSPIARRGIPKKRRRGGLQSSSSRASLRNGDDRDDFDPMDVDFDAVQNNERTDELDSDFEDDPVSSSEEEEVADSEEEAEVPTGRRELVRSRGRR